MDVNVVKEVLEDNGFEIVILKRYRNYGYRLKEKNGTAVFCYDNGKYRCQGKKSKEIKQILEKRFTKPIFNNKVFVAYGHDTNARYQIENLLRKWNLEPLLIDDLPTQGRTIIEQLENYIPQANFGIVLITPDDIGYPKEAENNKKYRARQNVVLELGMLLSKFGRSRVAVVIKESSDLEKPSDIHGLLYHSYKEKIDEISSKLAHELNEKGYNIPV